MSSTEFRFHNLVAEKNILNKVNEDLWIHESSDAMHWISCLTNQIRCGAYSPRVKHSALIELSPTVEGFAHSSQR